MIKIFYADVNSVKKRFGTLINSPSRQEYLISITDENRYRQSLAVWQLLEFVLAKYFNLWSPGFIKTESGRWQVLNSSVKFSLTHSKNLVAVAVSDKGEIGLDIEKITDKVLKLKKRYKLIETENLEEMSRILTEKWTEEESLYKSGLQDGFFKTEIVADCFNEMYAITVCSEIKDRLNIEKADM